jgi:hypothetical protein
VNRDILLSVALVSVNILASVTVQAHHSPNLHFDRSNIIEITGRLTDIDWQNPHTQFTVTTSAEDGSTAIWLIEGRGASQFARARVTADFFETGSNISFAGFRGRRNTTAMFATNILLANGQELVVDSFTTPRWSVDTALLLSASSQKGTAQNAPLNPKDIFRVWSPDRSDHGIDGTGRTLWLDNYPLTEFAQTTQSNWDPVNDNPYINCQNGMPAMMDLATPIEFVQDGDNIVLYLEEQDAVRRIRMPPQSSNEEDEAASPYGKSVGRWDGTTLEVTTTEIDWPWFDQAGIPQTAQLQLVERFTPSADGLVLRYQVTATDLAVFTEIVLLNRAWVWDSTEQLRPYKCVWDRSDL